ncbi:wax ester/triacylglycerol synthase domain-containing protein [Nocardia sp. BMG51109]|uniref:wax ester/triacylglycerol synthase domain-containing protein n=1 Tax=Nocardia sp. BMG51109 TaxID=1056816 RepID=UPI0018DC16DD|nr:wax ester/triacylglycerol synthase domain-containing protein [Nocardia sp. BMG51109]
MDFPVELKSLDCIHLRLDKPGHPMNWVLAMDVANAGGPIRVDEIRARIAERLYESSLYHMCLPKRDRRRPHFVQVSGIDLEAQVVEVDVESREDVPAQIEELMENQMPRRAPLWNFVLVNQKSEAAQTILLRGHHALSDGLGATGFAALLADTESGTTAEYARYVTSERFEVTGVGMRDAMMAGPRYYQTSRGGRRGRTRRFVRAKHSVRRVGSVSIPVATARNNALRAGGSTTEYIYAAVSAAYNRAFPRRDGKGLRMMFPVTLDRELSHTGNAASLAYISLDPELDTVAAQLAVVQSQLANTNPLEQAMELPKASMGLKYMPWRAQVLITQMSVADSWDLTVGVNPGFSPDQNLLGHQITRITAFPPLAGHELMLSALVFRNEITIGVIADPRALPTDIAFFTDCLEKLLTE